MFIINALVLFICGEAIYIMIFFIYLGLMLIIEMKRVGKRCLKLGLYKLGKIMKMLVRQNRL